MRARLWTLLAVASLLLLTLALVPGCGGGGLISKDQEIKMGRSAGDEFEKKYGRETDAQNISLVSGLAARIAPVAQPPEYPYEIRCLSSKEVNAVAFPGGRIYVFRGLIDALGRNQDQLAWVISHEAAHVARRHAAKRIETQLGFEAIIALVLNQGDTPKIAGAIGSLVLLDYGRDDEFEADQYGLRFTHAAGYDPTAAISVLLKFREIQGREPSDLEVMFMTHPGDDDRLNHCKDYLKEQSWTGSYWKP